MIVNLDEDVYIKTRNNWKRLQKISKTRKKQQPT